MSKLFVFIISLIIVIFGIFVYFRIKKYQQDKSLLISTINDKINLIDNVCGFIDYHSSPEFRCYAENKENCNLNKLKWEELLSLQSKLESEIDTCIETQPK